MGSRWDEAEQYAERAGRPDDPRTGIIRADAAYGAGDMTRAAVAAKDAVANAGPTDKPAALLVYGRVLAHDDPDAALAAFRQAAQVAAEHAMTPLRVAALIGEATVLANDEPVPAVLATARALAEPAGLLGQLTSIDLLTADLEHTANGATAGEPIARRAAEQAARLRLSPSEAVAALLVAGCRAGVGDIAGMGTWLQKAGSLANAPAEVTGGIPIVRAIAALVAGDFAAAVRLADEGAARLVSHRSASPTSLWGPWLVLRAYAGRPAEPERRPGATAGQPGGRRLRGRRDRGSCRPGGRGHGTVRAGGPGLRRVRLVAAAAARAGADGRDRGRLGRSGAAAARRSRRQRAGVTAAGPPLPRPAAPGRSADPAGSRRVPRTPGVAGLGCHEP